jgi:hypothetical protein
MPIANWSERAPGDVDSRSLDFDGELSEPGDSLVTVTWSAVPAGLGLASRTPTIAGAVATVWIDGGEVETHYLVTATATTIQGRTLVRSARIYVEQL